MRRSSWAHGAAVLWLVTFLAVLPPGPLAVGASGASKKAGQCDLRQVGTERAETLYGSNGDDYFAAGSGTDIAIGLRGDDCFDGGRGDDTLFGQSGRDRLNGNDGDDRILGGPGSDYIDGGAGDDDIEGGVGTLNTPSPAELARRYGEPLVTGARDGIDCISGGEGNDHIVLSTGRRGACIGGTRTGIGSVVAGGPGNDKIDSWNDGARDIVSCGPGADVAYAERVDIVASDCERVRFSGRYRWRVPPSLPGELGALRNRELTNLLRTIQPGFVVSRSDFQPVPISLLFAPHYVQRDHTRARFLVDRIIEGPSGEAIIQTNEPIWTDLNDVAGIEGIPRLTDLDFAASGRAGDAQKRFDDAWAAVGQPTTVYADGVSADPRGIKLSYWVFYTFNDAQTGDTHLGDHEGDWEHVDIDLNPQGVPQNITLSAHEGGTTVPWRGTTSRDGVLVRPGISAAGRSARIYVSRGTHANFPDCTVRPSFGRGTPAEVRDDPCYDSRLGSRGGPRVWDRKAGTTLSRFGRWVCPDAKWGTEGTQFLGTVVGDPPRSPWHQSAILQVGELGPGAGCDPGAAPRAARTRQTSRPVPGGGSDEPSVSASGATVLPGAGVMETSSRCSSYEPRRAAATGVVSFAVCSPSLLASHVNSGFDAKRARGRSPEMVPRGSRPTGNAGTPDVGQVRAVSDLGEVELAAGTERTDARLFIADCTVCERGGPPRWVAFSKVPLSPTGGLSRYRLKPDADGVQLVALDGRTHRERWSTGPPPTS